LIDNFIIGEANTLSLKRVFHPTDDASREVKKRYFISDPEGLVAADHTIFRAYCIDAAIDGLNKPFICPARVVNANGTHTNEVVLQIIVTECKDRRLDAYIRRDDGHTYHQKSFTTEFKRDAGRFTDQGPYVDPVESKQQFLDFLANRKEKFDQERFDNATGISRVTIVPSNGKYFTLR